MKLVKALLILTLLVISLIAALWTLNVLDSSQAIDFSKKAMALLGILIISSLAVSTLLGKDKSKSESHPPKQGPQF